MRRLQGVRQDLPFGLFRGRAWFELRDGSPLPENQFTVIRKVACHPGRNETVDMLLAANGLPVATIELKNPSTGRTWRHAVAQYRNDREAGALRH